MTVKTQYCLLPPNTIKAGHSIEYKSFYAITPAESKTINVEGGIHAFRAKHCSTCPIAIDEVTLVRKMEDIGLDAITPNKLDYCRNNKVCNKCDYLIEACQQGHTLEDMSQVTINVPTLMWVYDYSTKGKMAWRLYALQDKGIDNPYLNIRPYLLANVWSNHPGAICWGKTKKPRDLKEAYYFFWEAPFNSETTPNTLDMTSYVSNYDVFQDSNSKVTEFDSTKIDWCEDVTDGLVYSEESKFLEKLPPRALQNKSSVLIPITKTDSAFWLMNVNGYTCLKQGKLTGTSKIKILTHGKI